MVKKEVFILLCFLSLQIQLSTAQQKIKIGLGADYSAKVNLLCNPNSKVVPLYKVGLNGFLLINGNEDKSLKMQINFGTNWDRVRYKAYQFGRDYGYITADQNLLFINPEILISSEVPNLEFIYGIGIKYVIGTMPSKMEKGTNSINNNNYGFLVNLDELDSIATTQSKKIIPFVNIGVQYQIKPRLKLSLNLCQHLLNHYYKKTIILYQLGQEDKTLHLDYLPLYFSLGVNYYF